MFIYKYMAGFVDLKDAAGDTEESDYDPHKHRRIAKPITYAQTMIHMLKGSLGAGLLCMPNAMSRLGLILGSFGVIFIGFFVTYCIQILILGQYQICKRHKRGYMAYHNSMRSAVSTGPPCLRWSANILSHGVDVFLFLWQLGICAIYCVFVAENTKQILDFHGYEVSVRILICYCYPILLLMCLVKDLRWLTPFSTISNCCIMVGLILTFYYLIETDLVVDDEKFKVRSIGEIPIFIGITLFALEAVGVVLALEYNMGKPKEFTGVCGLFSVGMCIIIAIYVTLGIFGYLKYGNESKGSVTLNLPFHEKKAQAAKLTFAIALFLSYPLQNFVAWQIGVRKLRKKFADKLRLVDWVLRFVVATVPFGMAVAAPNLGAFMGLAGALCLSMVGILFPAVIDMSIYYPNRYGICYWRLASDVFIIVFGFFCCCSGVYTSILEMIEDYDL